MKSCPICDSIDIDRRIYTDEQGIVEEIEKCNTCEKTLYHWSYGTLFIDLYNEEKF